MYLAYQVGREALLASTCGVIFQLSPGSPATCALCLRSQIFLQPFLYIAQLLPDSSREVSCCQPEGYFVPQSEGNIPDFQDFQGLCYHPVSDLPESTSTCIQPSCQALYWLRKPQKRTLTHAEGRLFRDTRGDEHSEREGEVPCSNFYIPRLKVLKSLTFSPFVRQTGSLLWFCDSHSIIHGDARGHVPQEE